MRKRIGVSCLLVILVLVAFAMFESSETMAATRAPSNQMSTNQQSQQNMTQQQQAQAAAERAALADTIGIWRILGPILLAGVIAVAYFAGKDMFDPKKAKESKERQARMDAMDEDERKWKAERAAAKGASA